MWRMPFRRTVSIGLLAGLCLSFTGLGLFVHLRLAAHSHAAHSHDRCPTCFLLTIGSKAVMQQEERDAAPGDPASAALVPENTPPAAECYRVGSPRAPPIAG
ncbi:MAG: hypothetical protein ACPMAQ_05550 [Phycisphaerae bacterium]